MFRWSPLCKACFCTPPPLISQSGVGMFHRSPQCKTCFCTPPLLISQSGVGMFPQLICKLCSGVLLPLIKPGWNVSAVNNMREMFMNATTFNQTIGNWGVSSVINMNYMFSGSPFNQDLGKWSVPNHTTVENVFRGRTLSLDNRVNKIRRLLVQPELGLRLGDHTVPFLKPSQLGQGPI